MTLDFLFSTVGFSAAPIQYPLLGQIGCLEFFDARFFGQLRIVELETNAAFPGVIG